MSDDSIEFEFDASDDDSEEVCNISSQPARIHIDNLKVVLKPGQRIRVPKAYVRRHAMQQGRDPVASAIHMMTDGRVVPSSDPRVPKMAPALVATPVSRPDPAVAEMHAVIETQTQELVQAQTRIQMLEAELQEALQSKT